MIRITHGTPLEDEITIEQNGTPTDPTSLVFRYRRANDRVGTTETVVTASDPLNPPAPITRLGTGRYLATVTLPSTGDWRVRWESTSPDSSSEERVLVRSIYPGL